MRRTSHGRVWSRGEGTARVKMLGLDVLVAREQAVEGRSFMVTEEEGRGGLSLAGEERMDGLWFW